MYLFSLFSSYSRFHVLRAGVCFLFLRLDDDDDGDDGGGTTLFTSNKNTLF